MSVEERETLGKTKEGKHINTNRQKKFNVDKNDILEKTK